MTRIATLPEAQLGLTVPMRPQTFEAKFVEVSGVYRSLRECAESYGENKIERALQTLHAVEDTVSDLSAMLQSTSRLATREDIKNEIAGLVGCYLNAAQKDPRVFVGALARDLEEKAPTIAGLMWGMKKIRQTCRFFPTIAEVLEAVQEANAKVIGAGLMLEGLPALRAAAQTRLEEHRAIRERRKEWRVKEAAQNLVLGYVRAEDLDDEIRTEAQARYRRHLEEARIGDGS